MVLRRGKNRGYDVWIVELGYKNGRRLRSYHQKKADAEAVIAEAKVQLRKAGDFWISLKPEDRVEAADILYKAKAAGITLTKLWEDYVKNGGSTVTLTSLKKAIEETVASKYRQKLRPRYVEGLEQYLKLFAKGREDIPVSQIQPSDIEKWFAARGEGPAVRNANLGRLSSMFSVALTRGWVVKNPCDLVSKAKADRKSVEILSVRQSARALAWTCRHRPKMIGYLTMALFAGVRPEELEKVEWDSLKENSGKRLLVIEAEASKVRQRRIITLENAAWSWIDLAKSSGAHMPVSQSTRKRYIQDLRAGIRMESWPQDVLRHTAASHLLALRKDAAAVALELGNSAAILLRHYRALVTESENSRFWSLIPNKRVVTKLAQK